MAEVIRMPRMSDTMEEGVIVGWLKEVGDTVEPGDVLAEVETDKATMELENYHDGVLLHIGVQEGPVPVNGILAVIGEKGEDFQAALKEAEAADGGNTASSEATSAQNGSNEPAISAPVAVESLSSVAANGSATDSRIKASPLAKSMAAEAGIFLGTITGTGDNGRIVKRDIEAILEKAPVAAPAPPPVPAQKEAITPSPEKKEAPNVPAFSFNAGDQYEEEPVSQMRKTIARRLGESKFTAPHFYLTIEMDMAKAMKWRKQVNEVAPVKISYNDLVVKACAIALRQHPAINSSWMGDHIRRNGNINIGVAVAVDEGLLVPVIRYADMKSLSQINTEVKDMAGRARNKRLGLDEMSGNTFTVSNLGMFGIEEFTAIINPPDSCILAVGGIIEKPVVQGGKLAVGHRMKVTLSCDHRVVDGATGAQFLKTLKELIEDPIRLMV